MAAGPCLAVGRCPSALYAYVNCTYTVAVSPTIIYASYLGTKIVGQTFKGDTFVSDPFKEDLGYIFGTSNGFTGYVHAFDLTSDGCT
jgi:hypothetical protein